MVKPLALRLDYEVGAGYVRYRPLGDGEHAARTAKIGDDIVVDYNGDGDVLGIELLTFGDTALRTARSFASENGLEFPDGIAASARTG
jgi:uncharacterized protein YuzE